jgi:tetratricopeptide (TPR) repeat protein
MELQIEKKIEDYQGAITDYDQAIKLNPSDADAYISSHAKLITYTDKCYNSLNQK